MHQIYHFLDDLLTKFIYHKNFSVRFLQKISGQNATGRTLALNSAVNKQHESISNSHNPWTNNSHTEEKY